MEKILIRQFQVEVERQCQFAMIALQDMEEASANSDGKLFWYAVQNLLVAVGRISRLLWPPDPLFPKRGEELRESLGVGEESPLKALTFVEHFEHFDKRLRSEEHTSELQSRQYLVCRLLLEKKTQACRPSPHPLPYS